MRCIKCKKAKHENDLLYNRNTLELECRDCIVDITEMVPQENIEEFLSEYFPEVLERSQKVTSARLDISEVLYLLKFAQENETVGNSETVSKMIQRLRKIDPLHHIELKESSEIRRKNKKDFKFLNTRTVDKEVITIGTENMIDVPAIELEEKDDKDDEEVFTL